ncbi:MAG: hypothetical protein GY898_10870 [Proteobacteria bacterium]|nr:hypothetical protein [Pseudomonadota bacterium]
MDSGSTGETLIILAIAAASFIPALVLGMLVGWGFSRIVGKTEEGDNVATAAASGFMGALVGTPIAAITTVVLWGMFACGGFGALAAIGVLQ